MSILYENLFRLCEERGITAYRMCKDIKIQPSIMTDLKMGRRSSVKAETAQKMAKYFGVTTDYLLGKSRFRNTHEMMEYWGDMGPYFEAQFDFGDLVKQEREAQGRSIEEMAEYLGITSQDVADCEAGVLPINRELADRMATFLGTNVSQMLFNNNLYSGEVPEEYHNRVAEWEKLCEAAEQDAVREAADWKSVLPPNAAPIDLSKYHQIPILGRISAGLPLYAEEHIEGYTLTDLNGGAEYFALRVHGDSMNAIGINDGYLIVVRRQDEVEQGEIAVVLVDEEDATVKRFYSSDTTVTLMPQSTNPEHKPQMYDLKKTRIRVLGKVAKVEFFV